MSTTKIAKKTFPNWIRQPWPSGKVVEEVKSLLGDLNLHSVCQSAHCPNQSECWGRKTATFMVMGNTCTRHCTYCAVNSGRPGELDLDEPANIAEAVRRLGLKHTVITSVTRDDLPDGGAQHIADTIQAIKAVSPETTIEVLVQDFDGKREDIARIQAAAPEVFSHNIETVASVFPRIRDRRFTYTQSLDVLRIAKELSDGHFIKSSFMLGCGETEAEIRQTLIDLKEAGCDAVSMGQYLQPTPKHHPVEAYIAPEQFKIYEAMAYEIGLGFAVAGAFVRSSYRSEALLESDYAKARRERKDIDPHAD
ncbi:MAG: lipoyl synthase [Candidatus Hydrogenedentes bacterium]|nr:lipoyl synthase [Candidatus Hydrogenedentota bacterium]